MLGGSALLGAITATLASPCRCLARPDAPENLDLAMAARLSTVCSFVPLSTGWVRALPAVSGRQ